MIRRIFSFVVIAAVLASCGNTGNKEASTKTEGQETGVKVEFAALSASPDDYVGKNIVVEGKVVHVCTQSGKKLFIVGENPNVRLFIAAGEEMPKFPMELLGSEVVVEGVITKVGGPAIASAEKHEGSGEGMHAGEGAGKPAASDSCETEIAVAGQSTLADIVMEYKSHTVK